MKAEEKDTQSLSKLILESEIVLILTHSSPDGDALGSVSSLGWQLKRQEKTVFVVISEELSSRFDFLSISRSPRLPERYDLVFVLDCETLDRIGDETIISQLRLSQVPLVNIDHHATNSHFGTLNYVTQVSSTCELLYELYREMNWVVDIQDATSLLTGLIDDTGNFRYPNTSPQTLRVAAELMEVGADLNMVNDYLFKSFTIDDLSIWAKVLASSQISGDGQFILSRVVLDDFAQGHNGIIVTNDLVHTMLRVKSARLAILLREMTGNRVGVSVRSSHHIDSSIIAQALGGGGHPRAAGAFVTGPLDDVETKVLETVKTLYGIVLSVNSAVR